MSAPDEQYVYETPPQSPRVLECPDAPSRFTRRPSLTIDTNVGEPLGNYLNRNTNTLTPAPSFGRHLYISDSDDEDNVSEVSATP